VTDTEEGNTPLHYAAYRGHVECVRLLLSAGAVDRPNLRNKTALDKARTKGHREVIKVRLFAHRRIPSYTHSCEQILTATSFAASQSDESRKLPENICILGTDPKLSWLYKVQLLSLLVCIIRKLCD
jgi:hypothetical protein